MRHAFLAIVLLAGCLYSPAASARRATASLPLTAEGSVGTVVAPARLAGRHGSSLVTLDGTEVVDFVELAFPLPAPAGTIVELWPRTRAGRPWSRSANEPVVEPMTWRVDDRTEAVVRFDITKLVQGWAATNDRSVTMPGFLLRFTDAEGNALSTQGLPAAVDLTVHLLPNPSTAGTADGETGPGHSRSVDRGN